MNRGFTLLEVLVATLLMAIAIVTLLSALGTSLRNAARLTDHDRVAMLARSKMDELLADRTLPLDAHWEGRFDPSQSGGEEAGFETTVSLFEGAPTPAPGRDVLQRIVLKVWWKPDQRPRTMELEAFRRTPLPAPKQ